MIFIRIHGRVRSKEAEKMMHRTVTAAYFFLQQGLVADEGLLWLVDQARRRGVLPADLVVFKALRSVASSVEPSG